MSAEAPAIRDLADDPRLAVEIAIGIEGWHTGRITLGEEGDGNVTVRQQLSGEEHDYSGRLDRERLRELADELADDDLTELARSDEATVQPDDVPVTIRVLRDGAVLHQAELRHSDRWRDKRVDRLVRRYDALVSEVTDGALPYGRRP
jgi:hypothetical protein